MLLVEPTSLRTLRYTAQPSSRRFTLAAQQFLPCSWHSTTPNSRTRTVGHRDSPDTATILSPTHAVSWKSVSASWNSSLYALKRCPPRVFAEWSFGQYSLRSARIHTYVSRCSGHGQPGASVHGPAEQYRDIQANNYWMPNTDCSNLPSPAVLMAHAFEVRTLQAANSGLLVLRTPSLSSDQLGKKH